MGEEGKKQEEEEEETKTGEPEKHKETEEPEIEKIQYIQVEQTNEIVLRVFMHCEGCARKVRRCLKGFQGVETVHTDCTTHKVVVKVKGGKVDPLKVLGRVQRKSHRRVELISPIPEPPPPQPTHNPKTEDSKPQPQIITVVLKVHMHCQACAQEIKRRIHRMKGVESVDPDLKSSQVTVKGAIDPTALVEYVHRRTGKHAAIVKQEPEIKPENLEEAAKEANDEKKGEEEKKGEGGESEKKVEEESKVEEKTGGGDGGEAQPAAEAAAEEAPTAAAVEVKKNEYLCCPQRYIMEMYPYPAPIVGDVYPAPHMVVDANPPPNIGHAYPPQMFSDENPNACSVM